MRSSDWSSDGCSSDLLGVLLAGVIGIGDLAERLRHRQQHLVDEGDRLRRPHMLAEFLQQGALRLGLAIHHADVAEKITESVASEVLLQVLPLRRVGVAPGALDGSDRSEEHTSELQSLMRISYAVFCL